MYFGRKTSSLRNPTNIALPERKLKGNQTKAQCKALKIRGYYWSEIKDYHPSRMQIAYHEGEKGIDGTVEISAGFEVRIYIKVKNAEGGREVEKEEVIHFGDSRFEYSVHLLKHVRTMEIWESVRKGKNRGFVYAIELPRDAKSTRGFTDFWKYVVDTLRNEPQNIVRHVNLLRTNDVKPHYFTRAAAIAKAEAEQNKTKIRDGLEPLSIEIEGLQRPWVFSGAMAKNKVFRDIFTELEGINVESDGDEDDEEAPGRPKNLKKKKGKGKEKGREKEKKKQVIDVDALEEAAENGEEEVEMEVETSRVILTLDGRRLGKNGRPKRPVGVKRKKNGPTPVGKAGGGEEDSDKESNSTIRGDGTEGMTE